MQVTSKTAHFLKLNFMVFNKGFKRFVILELFAFGQ